MPKKPHALKGKPSNRGNHGLTERLQAKVRPGTTERLKAAAKLAGEPIGVHLSNIIDQEK